MSRQSIEKIRERLEEVDGRIDVEEYVNALAYVREDGRERLTRDR